MRRAVTLLSMASLLALVCGCGGAKVASVAHPSARPSPSPAALWPVIGHWRPGTLTHALPGLLVSRAPSAHRGKLVMQGLDGATKGIVWSYSQQLVHFDCNPASGEIAATVVGKGWPYPYAVVVLRSDATIRRVTSGVVRDWSAIPSPLLLADGAVMWERQRLVSERQEYSAWFAARGGVPQRVSVAGDLAAGFQLDQLVPLAGRRSVALCDFSHGAVVLADWSNGRLTVRGRPYHDSSAPPMVMGAALAAPRSLLLQSLPTEGGVRAVGWQNGRSTARLVLAKLPSGPYSGDQRPIIGAGPAGSALLYGWWPGEQVGGRPLGSAVPLLRVDLRTGAVTQTHVLFTTGTDAWQWVQ
jgi:hypothetical protein